METDFLGRTTTPRALGSIALRWNRLAFAALLSILPPLVIFLFAWLGSPQFRDAIVDTRNVHDAFARFVSGVATASSIAVSVAALTMRRDLHGLRMHEERHETNEEYRRRVRERLGRKELAVELGPFLADLLDGIADKAKRAAQAAGPNDLPSYDVDLHEYLETLQRRARLASARVRDVAFSPDHLMIAALDFEHEVTARLAHRYVREAPSGLRERLEELRDLVDDYILAQKFLKTLDTQSGLSRMSIAILLSTLPSIAAATVMVLGYGQGAIDALGALGAAAVVCGALAVVLFPLGCFVSYVLRFLFLNQHTLPTDGFLLGPEAKPLRRDVTR